MNRALFLDCGGVVNLDEKRARHLDLDSLGGPLAWFARRFPER
jgi:hypothetical protein